jgi:hypothetical protein
MTITYKRKSRIAEWVYADGEQVGYVMLRHDGSYSAIDGKGQAVGHGLPDRDSAANVVAGVKR